MGLAPDPADRALDAAADGAFGGRGVAPENRRAGYGSIEYEGRIYSKYGWLLRAAEKGACLAYGESRELLSHIAAADKVAQAAERYITHGGQYSGYAEIASALEEYRLFKESKGIE